MNRRRLSAKRQMQRLLRALVGRSMWGNGRAADMFTFQFGKQINRLNRLKKMIVVGEYALHVQCAWRICLENQVVVAKGDLYYPANFEESKRNIAPDFDWDRHPNRCDRLLKTLFQGGKQEFKVESIELGTAGGLRLNFEQDLLLEIVPDNSLPDEHWRLLAPGKNQPHLVMRTDGTDS